MDQKCEYSKLIWSRNIENDYVICEIKKGSKKSECLAIEQDVNRQYFPRKGWQFLNQRNFLPTSSWQNICKNEFGGFSHRPAATTDYAEPAGSFAHLLCLLLGDVVMS